MSEIQNDKEVLRDLNTSEYKGIDAPLRDQIPAKLLEQCRELGLGTKVEQLWHRGNADRTNWLERQQTYLANWDEFLVGNSDGPFEQSSNLHIPMPFIVAKTYHARLLSALLALDPVTQARRADGVEKARVVSDVMRYTLNDWANHHQGTEQPLDAWVWDYITTGVGLLKWRWEKRFVSFVDVEEELVPGPLVYIEGQAYPGPPVVREREVKRRKEVFNGPVLDHIRGEDLLIIGDPDPDNADFVMQRQYLTKSELFGLSYQKIFDQDAVEETIESGPDYFIGDEASTIKEQRRTNSGQTDPDNEADLDRYEILETYLKADIDNSGIDSDIVLWVHPASRTILRATYLHRINKSGKRPFSKADFYLRPGQTYGAGLIEVLYPLSVELDLMHNTRNDFGMLSTMPFGFYKASSSIDPETFSFEPGMLIPTDDPRNDIYFPQLGNRTAYGMQEEQGLYTLIERLTGMSNLQFGVLGSQQGVTRTATGAQSLQLNSNANLDVHMRRMFRAWERSLDYLLHLLQQRIPTGLSFRLTGEDGSKYWAEARTRDDIAGEFDFELDVASAASDPQVREQRAMQVAQITSNPLNLQLGIVSPLNHYEALKDWLKASGVKNVSKYITRPQGFALMLTPEEMANRILRGDDLPVMPTDDNEGFLAFAEMIMSSDELLGQFETEAIVRLERQRRQRAALLQAQKQQEAQAANVAQQRLNMQQSMNPQVGAAPLER